MNEITRASGLTLAGLLFHHESETALFTAVLRAREPADIDGLLARLGPEPGGFEVRDAVPLQIVAMSEGLENQWPHEPDRIDHPGAFAARAEAFAATLRA